MPSGSGGFICFAFPPSYSLLSLTGTNSAIRQDLATVVEQVNQVISASMPVPYRALAEQRYLCPISLLFLSRWRRP